MNEQNSTHEKLMGQAYLRWTEHDARVREDYALVIKAAVDVLGEEHDSVLALRRDVVQKLWSKEDFWAQLDEQEKIAVLIGNLNYQVCNGGWQQWCNNDYVACADELEDALHKIGTWTAIEVASMVAKVMYAWKQFEEEKDETPRCEFCRCSDDDDCDCETEEDVWQAAHDGFCSVVEPLDDWFYEINEQLMSEVEKFLNEEDPKKNSAPVPSSKVEATRIRCKLTGRDGNAFFIIGTVSEALRSNGRSDLIEPFRAEAMSGDYNGVLQAAMKYVEVV